ncbi:hypothetical protein ACJ73_09743 [Blastomyces percursus]|uniref:Uncharacterized protein n=1 Tax=Blastomyces percursus TaxID=1658174 RepID=A0A1J9P1F6_9EURO|nr:hypothetical protein ACJ73_09743 [Blastomyces percursus]
MPLRIQDMTQPPLATMPIPPYKFRAPDHTYHDPAKSGPWCGMRMRLTVQCHGQYPPKSSNSLIFGRDREDFGCPQYAVKDVAEDWEGFFSLLFGAFDIFRNAYLNFGPGCCSSQAMGLF